MASTAWSDRCPDDDQVFAKNVTEFCSIMTPTRVFPQKLTQYLSMIRTIKFFHFFFLTILSYDDNDDQNIRIVKLDSNLEVEWTEEYGECDGSDQLFDFVVDRLVNKQKKQKKEDKTSATEIL